LCAAEKTDDPEGKLLFKALGKIEAEHAQSGEKYCAISKCRGETKHAIWKIWTI